MKLSFDNLTVNNGTTVIYQNLNSLSSKLRLIVCDQWYLRGDILIFTETLSKSTDEYQIPNFVEIFRSDVQCSSRGVICFARKGIDVSYLDHSLEIGEKNINQCEYHVELFSIKIRNCFIISGYKSPHCRNEAFENNFRLMYNKTYENDKQLIVLGDFNFDMKSERKTDLIRIFNNYNLFSVLPIEISTTELNTHIDVIFSTNKCETGVYETYFSYHKPIFVKFDMHRYNDRVQERIPTISHEKIKNVLSSSVGEIQNNISNNNTNKFQDSSSIRAVDDFSKKNEKNTVELLGFKERNSQIAQKILSEIREVNVLLSENEYRERLAIVFSKYNEYVEMTKRCVASENNVILNAQVVDTPRNEKIYNALKENFSVVETIGDGSCLYRSLSFCLFGTQELHKCIRMLCCYIFYKNWLYFEDTDRMGFLFDYQSVIQLINSTADIKTWGNEAHTKAIAIASNRDIYVYQGMTAEDNVNKFNTLGKLQEKCDLQQLQTTHYLFTKSMLENNHESMSLKPIAVLFTDAGTSGAHYSAILPKNTNAVLLKPKYRADARPAANSQSEIIRIDLE